MKSNSVMTNASKRKHKKREAHGQSNTPLYMRWVAMVARCHNPAHADYKTWGGKGVKVCQRWRKSFLAYAEDVGQPPFKGAHLARINPTGDYRKDNVAWTTNEENLKSSRSVRRIKTHAGEMTMADAARDVGKDPLSVQARVRGGMAPAKALIIDKHVQKHIAIKYPQAQELKLSTIRTVAREAGVTYHALRSRIADGLNVADAINDIRSSTHGKLASDARNNGLRPNTATLRIRNGWSYEAATTTPARARAA